MIPTEKETAIQLNTIEEAIADIKNGKVIIVVDDKAVSYTHLTLPTIYSV